MKTNCYIITGRVQGVGFRYFVWQHAEILGLNGWVRNRTDGSVEALVRATESQHEQIRRHLGEGPRGSRVESVHATELDCADLSAGFEIRRDGG